MASFQEEWLTVEDSIRKRGIFMFNNDLLSDVSLVVETSSDESEPKAKKTKMAIPAHKVVLSICSPVFFAMFCGELAEKSDSIDLPDCEYEGVLEMLRYMYGEKAKLNEGNVLQVLYAAKKYIVKSLADECIKFLKLNLEPANVLCVLPHAEQYDEKVLVDQCWEVIDRETEEVVKSEGFGTIERSLLEAVVKRDALTIKEVELFKAIELWTTKECERRQLTADGCVKRRILGEAIVQLIRFPVMEEKDFADVVLDSGILLPREVINMMKHFNSVLKTSVGFHGDNRVGALQSCFRFINVTKRQGGGDVSFHASSHFHMDQDIVLHGVCLFGNENSEYEVTLSVNETHSGLIVVSKSGKYSCILKHRRHFCYYCSVVMFDPVILSRDIHYSMNVEISGPLPFRGVHGAVQDIMSHGVTFSFESPPSIRSGQFADILFKVP